MHQSLRGNLLLDGGLLQGSYFHRTVILVCSHTEEGAFGLVLNRPSTATVGEALTADLPPGLKLEPLFVGGPVGESELSYLYSDNFLSDANVMLNLKMGHSLEELAGLGESLSTTQRIRVFAGYAGWGPKQLEGEMERGAWLTHPASPDLVFEECVQGLWKMILKTRGWKHRLLADSPDDPSAN